MRRLAVLIALLSLARAGWAADLVVVANPSSGVVHLTRNEVINIFFGRYRQLPSGLVAQPVDEPATLPEKADFYQQLVGKDLAEINSYWARLTFSGRTQPPRQAASTQDLLGFVTSTSGAIGYIDRTKVNDRVRVVYEFAP